jgi:hypothetical protein
MPRDSIVRLINDEWFRIRIIFQDGVIAGGYACGVLHGSPQFKTDVVPALPANGEASAFQQSGFVHQAMRRMCDPVNPTFGYQITRLVFLSHPVCPSPGLVTLFGNWLILKDH